MNLNRVRISDKIVDDNERLLLAAFCLWRWKTGRNALQLDLNLPGYSQLRERLMPSSERLGVNDTAPEHLHNVQAGHSDLQTDGALIVAIELDDGAGAFLFGYQ